MTAVFTIARNEAFFLPLWLAYYGGQFGLENCYVLDHDSDDGSTADLPCHVVRVGRPVCYDHRWLADTASAFQADLLTRGYSTVVYSDVDELLLHPLGLRGFVQTGWRGACRARGYQMVQAAGEAPYDAMRPVLAQRGWWKRDRLYDKTLLSREPLEWEVGFHYLEGHINASYAEGLTLVHLHSFDRAVARRRHEERRGWPWSAADLAGGRALHWLLEGEALERWLDAQADGAEPVAEWLVAQVPF